MSETPVTMTDIAFNLSRMSRELARATYELGDLEERAVEAREAFAMAWAVEYLKSGEADENGKPASVETRKARATLATHDERLKAETAEARIRKLKGEIGAVKVRIDCARSSGTILRAELELDKVR